MADGEWDMHMAYIVCDVDVRRAGTWATLGTVLKSRLSRADCALRADRTGPYGFNYARPVQLYS